MTNNQRGFGLIELLLVILAIGLVVTTSYIVYSNRNSGSQDASSDQEQNSQTNDDDQLPADKRTYTSEGEVDLETVKLKTFSVTVPLGWTATSKSHGDACGDGKILETVELTKGDYSISMTANHCGRDASYDDSIGFGLDSNNHPNPEKDSFELCTKGQPFCSAGDGRLDIGLIDVRSFSKGTNHFHFLVSNNKAEIVSNEEFRQILTVVKDFKLVP